MCSRIRGNLDNRGAGRRTILRVLGLAHGYGKSPCVKEFNGIGPIRPPLRRMEAAPKGTTGGSSAEAGGSDAHFEKRTSDLLKRDDEGGGSQILHLVPLPEYLADLLVRLPHRVVEP